MSSVAQYTDTSAIRFNARAAVEIGWYGRIPEDALHTYPDLAWDPIHGNAAQKQAFADTVFEFQFDAGFDAWAQDKMLGLQTWEELFCQYAPVSSDMDYIIHAKQRIPFPAVSFELLTWDNEGGLDLHYDGGWAKNKQRVIDWIVVHWGGINAKSCWNALASQDLSSHFGTDRAVAYQWLDTKHTAYHGGSLVNSRSIGIDVCQHPVLKMLKHYKKGYQGVASMKNPTPRGNRQVLSLDERTRVTTRELVLSLCDTFNVPVRAPRGSDGLSDSGPVFHGSIADAMKKGKFRGVVAHHHFSKKKWDVACWWEQLFAGTALGD